MDSEKRNLEFGDNSVVVLMNSIQVSGKNTIKIFPFLFYNCECKIIVTVKNTRLTSASIKYPWRNSLDLYMG